MRAATAVNYISTLEEPRRRLAFLFRIYGKLQLSPLAAATSAWRLERLAFDCLDGHGGSKDSRGGEGIGAIGAARPFQPVSELLKRASPPVNAWQPHTTHAIRRPNEIRFYAIRHRLQYVEVSIYVAVIRGRNSPNVHDNHVMIDQPNYRFKVFAEGGASQTAFQHHWSCAWQNTRCIYLECGPHAEQERHARPAISYNIK
ncbi:MAG: hypothetical protein LQ338_005984 [Usnochroma carphineum]|nr:MAG: hypothetical protein LQ338_005984 [Usnochroma carphineum]